MPLSEQSAVHRFTGHAYVAAGWRGLSGQARAAGWVMTERRPLTGPASLILPKRKSLELRTCVPGSEHHPG